MNSRISDYMSSDGKQRRRDDLNSIVIGFIVGLVCFAFGLAINICAWATASLVAISMMYFTWRYCHASVISAEETARGPLFWRRKIFSASWVLPAIAAIFRSQSLAAAYNRELEAIVNGPEDGAAKRAYPLVRQANARRVPLAPSILSHIVRLDRSTEEVRSAFYADINRRILMHGLRLPVLGLIVWRSFGTGAITLTGVPGDQTDHFDVPVNGPYSYAPPELVAFIGPIGSPVTHPKSSGAAYIQIDGVAQDFRMPLDGQSYRNVLFLNCRLLYQGGSLQLDTCAFAGCDLDFADSFRCQKLAEVLLANSVVNFQHQDAT
jgi:hypothetical protein